MQQDGTAYTHFGAMQYHKVHCKHVVFATHGIRVGVLHSHRACRASTTACTSCLGNTSFCTPSSVHSFWAALQMCTPYGMRACTVPCMHCLVATNIAHVTCMLCVHCIKQSCMHTHNKGMQDGIPNCMHAHPGCMCFCF